MSDAELDLVDGDGEPDMTIHVSREDQESDDFIYHFRVRYPSLKKPIECGQMRYLERLSKKVSSALSTLDEMSASLTGRIISERDQKAFFNRLMGIGEDLWEQLLPDRIKDEIRRWLSAHSKGKDLPSLQIYSQEPWIPWEILCPFPNSNGLDEPAFLCELCAMARWLAIGKDEIQSFKSPGSNLGLQGMITGAWLEEKTREQAVKLEWDMPEISNWIKAKWKTRGKHDSKHVESEITSINRFLRKAGGEVTEVDARLYDVTCAIKEWKHDFYHIIAHGWYDGHVNGNHQLYDPTYNAKLRLNDYEMKPVDVRGESTNDHRACTTLVFLNACHSARTWPMSHYTDLSGWINTWAKKGCGAFLAPLYSVSDDLAKVFARSVYKELAKGTPLGLAVVKARKKTKRRDPANPTWLAYSLYADPLARNKKCFRPMA